MFQITCKRKHPVKESGLITLLENLQLMDAVREKQISAQLIFVVTQGLGESYQPQEIDFLGKLSGKDLKTSPCTDVPRIGLVKKSRLSKMNINSCYELLKMYENDAESINFVKKDVERLLESLENPNFVEFLKDIPQYVIEIPYTSEIEF